MMEAFFPQGFAVEPVTFYYRPAGEYDFNSGTWDPASSITATMRASVQRANGEDLRNVPELQRADSYYKIYTTAALETVNETTGVEPYQVVWQSERWRVVHVERWQMNTLDHRKILITRETRNQQEGVNP